MKKIVLCSILFFVAIIILRLPDSFQQGFDQMIVEQGFENLPDVDLRIIAEQEWDAGRKETGISILDYMIDENLGDAPSAKILREEYLNRIQSDKSISGRIRSASYGFATGKVDDFSSLAGSSVADFIIYGDVRDIVREIVFEDETDEIVVALSAAGIVTTIFPPGEAAITVTKALKKVSAFSAPMIEMLKKMLKGFKDMSDIGKMDKVKEIFMPFYHLAKQSKSWTEFITLVKYSQNLDHIKLFTKLSSLSPNNAKQLSQILAIAGNHGAKLSIQSVDYLTKYGQKGMDNLYSVLRKGPAGIRFLADHPTLVARSLKNVKKATPLGLNFIEDQWMKFVVNSQIIAIALKYGIALSLMLFVGYHLLSLFGVKQSAGQTGRKKMIVAFLLASGLITFFILFNTRNMPSQMEFPQNFSSRQAGVGSSFAPQQGSKIGDVSFLAIVLIINIFMQTYCINLAKDKINRIQEQQIQSSTKLSLMENLDIYFDLPMYFGLAMTILAFILITFLGAESARLWAYFSTLIGIGCTAYMRVNFLHKAKEKVINEIQLESNQENF